ncbi:MAG: M13 family metallopeptidase [Candidatus Neomarinimicrobiota bacterium]
MKRIILGLLLLTLLCGCAKDDSAVKAFDPAGMDLSVKPGDDFYQYVNGNWQKNNPIPPEYSNWGSFTILFDENFQKLKSIMETAASSRAAKGSNLQKIGDFYASGMDTNKINSEGLAGLQEELDLITNIKTKKDVQAVITQFHQLGINPLFTIFKDQDPQKSEMVTIWLYQGGYGLPDRDYYLGNDGRSQEIQNAYRKHLVIMFKLMSEAPEVAQKSMQTVMKIETDLARSAMTNLEERDPIATCNRMDVAGLKKIAGNYDWSEYFSSIGLANIDTFNIAQPKFFSQVSRLIDKVKPEEWQAYLRWHLVHATAARLDTNFVNENFAFYGKFLSGQQELLPRWKRILNATSNSLDEIVGQIYVEKYFPPKAKKRALELVANLKAAFAERIKAVDWMSPETKEKALVKLDAFNVKIGYPDKWQDFSDLEITRDSYVRNALNVERFKFARDMAKVGKPVDRTEWLMPPQTVNAYYNPAMNEIVFPAAILQPPFFNFKADDAINYGGIGMVIGHEMTHGFDDQGRQYDKDGNVNDWWTKADQEEFNKRTEVLVNQFNQFVPIDTFHINGHLTLGENIADLGGMLIAYDALQKALVGKKIKPIDGFTPEQRFFLSQAQIWHSNIRDELLKLLIKTDPHSPAKFRVNGPVSNIDAFYTAYDIQPNDKLYIPPENRAKIW